MTSKTRSTMQPIVDHDTPGVGTLRDRAKDGFDLERLERLLRDCEDQPEWRARADLAHAYYDGKQLTREQIEARAAAGVSERPTNLIARVINSVLGSQAKGRKDPRVEADDDDYADVAEALNMRLKEAVRETRAHMAVSNAYGSGVKGGIGWVEVSRCSDPLDYRYRVEDVHRNEIWWDWRCKSLDISAKARWLVRAKWYDLDDLQALMPEHAAVLEMLVDNVHAALSNLISDDILDERWQSTFNTAFNDSRRFGVARAEWVDGARKRLKLYEVWYRVPARALVMRIKGDRWRLVDRDNPLHQEAMARGIVEVEERLTSQVRRALFAGCYRLYDEGTTRRRFPYHAFIAFRDDQDNTPYGLIEGMISPQDGYNERRARIDWMLKAQQLEIDNDALDESFNTVDDVVANMMRPDMVTVLNANRRNPASALKFRNDLTLQKEQWESMQNDQLLIQQIPGVHSTQLGEAGHGVTAGNAIASLVEQGEVAMGELNDNQALFESIVFESLLDLIVDDIGDHEIEVTVGSGDGRRPVVLNTRDEQGRPLNMVRDAPVRCGLSEVPQSPAYRAQLQQQLADIIKALAGNPQAAAVLTPVYIETSSHPDRQRMADDLRRISGIPTASDRRAQAEAAKQAADDAKAQRDMERADKQADVALKQANAGLSVARTREIEVRNALAPIQQGHQMAMDMTPEPDEEELAIEAALQEAAMGGPMNQAAAMQPQMAGA